MTAKTDDRQKRIREQENIIRRALTSDKITYAEERAIIEPAHQKLDELEGEPELEELNLTKPKGFTPLQRATEAIRNASHDKFDAALRAYLREITTEAIAAGVPLDPGVRSALLEFQASQHREPLKQKRRLDRSNRLYYEVFCDENCEEKHKHKFYSDVLRARPDAKRKRRLLPPIQNAESAGSFGYRRSSMSAQVLSALSNVSTDALALSRSPAST